MCIEQCQYPSNAQPCRKNFSWNAIKVNGQERSQAASPSKLIGAGGATRNEIFPPAHICRAAFQPHIHRPAAAGGGCQPSWRPTSAASAKTARRPVAGAPTPPQTLPARTRMQHLIAQVRGRFICLPAPPPPPPSPAPGRLPLWWWGAPPRPHTARGGSRGVPTGPHHGLRSATTARALQRGPRTWGATIIVSSAPPLALCPGRRSTRRWALSPCAAHGVRPGLLPSVQRADLPIGRRPSPRASPTTVHVIRHPPTPFPTVTRFIAIPVRALRRPRHRCPFCPLVTSAPSPTSSWHPTCPHPRPLPVADAAVCPLPPLRSPPRLPRRRPPRPPHPLRLEWGLCWHRALPHWLACWPAGGMSWWR